MIKKLRSKLARTWKRRHFYLANLFEPAVPPHNVSFLPDGFAVRQLGDTGLTLIENFCTPEEANDVIEAARNRLARSGVFIDGKFQDHEGRFSYTAELFGSSYRHDKLFPLLQRSSMLTGIPPTHVEAVYVTRYPEGGLYNEHIDYGDAYEVDRLYTVLLYLNTVPDEQGGATVFPKLRASIQPRVGRAVTWTNKNPDGSGHLEKSHAAFPVKNGGEKWVIQFWFRRYPMTGALQATLVPQTKEGRPLSADQRLPEGVTVV